MQDYQVRYIGDPILEKRCERVTDFSDLGELINAMQKAQIENRTYGISAPQVGDGRQVIMMKGGEVYINPKIVSARGFWPSPEACISLPRAYYLRLRHAHIEVEYHDEKGNSKKKSFSHWQACAIEHEIDHLNGILTNQRGFLGGILHKKQEEQSLNTE